MSTAVSFPPHSVLCLSFASLDLAACTWVDFCACLKDRLDLLQDLILILLTFACTLRWCGYPPPRPFGKFKLHHFTFTKDLRYYLFFLTKIRRGFLLLEKGEK